MANILKEEKEQIEALKIAQKDLLEKLEDLQTYNSKLEEQLQNAKQVQYNV